jgi:pantetheine-phosphate adenylyltransferase
MALAIYAGTFDPLTEGHISVVRQAVTLFGHVVVLVADNPEKKTLFDAAERVELAREALQSLPTASVASTRGMVVDYARQVGAQFLVRGVRGATDAQFEAELARVNKKLAPGIQTVFFPAEDSLASVSSSRLKDMARRGESLAGVCPPSIAERLARKIAALPPTPVPALRLLPLGVGDAFASQHYSFSLALESAGVWLLVDCPHPIQKMIREAEAKASAGLSPDKIAAVALTHLHADHVSGLEGFAYFNYFVFQKKTKLAIHPAVEERLWDGHLSAGMECLLPKVGEAHVHKKFADYFETAALDETKALEIGPFRIECRRTIHHIPTTALRISAGGRSIGISADTAFDESLIEWLSAADLVVHETNYGVHTPYEKLAALPEALRRKMRLVHYPDTFEKLTSVISVLEEGKLVVV